MKSPKIIALSCVIFFLWVQGGIISHPADFPEARDFIATSDEGETFHSFLALLQAAGYGEVLQSETPLTVFAPTDKAFAKLPEGTMNQLMHPGNYARLRAIASSHIIEGAIRESEFKGRTSARTLEGRKLRIRTRADQLYVQHARILQSDIGIRSGLVHVIDRVIIPR